MNRLERTMNELRERGEKALVAYLPAGDPGFEKSIAYVREVIAAGADVVELGVPHTDPIADGPVNARAAARAIANGGGLSQTIDIARALRAAGETAPLVLFTYYNPIFRFGLDAFAEVAAASGIDGVLTVDLPPEEASAYHAALGAKHLSTVFLAAPTTPAERLPLLDDATSGFLYYVSRTGVTGARTELPPRLAEELRAVRERVKHPLCVGFGISTPEQAAAISPHCDGVVVGSALVEKIERGLSLAPLTSGIKKAMKESTVC